MVSGFFIVGCSFCFVFVWGFLCVIVFLGVSFCLCLLGVFKVRGTSTVHSIQSAGAHTLGEVLCSFLMFNSLF